MTNHAIEERDGRVVKRFASCDLDQPAREWRALTLLAEHAPGLAPLPVAFHPQATPPEVVMSRVEGASLRGGRVGPEQTAALAAAVSRLWDAVPEEELASLPWRAWPQPQVLQELQEWCGGPLPPGTDPVVAQARDEGLRWLRRADLADASPPVLGTGDGNLTNFLWDGSRVRVVDFEYSGRSDRAYELAEVAEHVATWVDTEFDAARFLAHFDLPPAEAARLLQARRLMAFEWLHVLSLQVDAAHWINPPGTREHQAERLLALL